jgi:hypothetical protein
MPRYVLTGGQYAFLGGRLVYVGEVFELPEGKRPPKFSRRLEDDEVPEETPEEPVENPALSEMQIGKRTAARQSDVEPV